MFCCFVILLVFRTFGSGSEGKKRKERLQGFFKSYLFLHLEERILTIPQAFMKILAFINVLLSQKKCGGPIHIRSLGKGITDNEFSL